MRRLLSSRRSAALVISLAFVVGFLGVAAIIADMTASDRIASISHTNTAQAELAAGAGAEEGVAFLEHEAGTTMAGILSAAESRSNDSPPGARSAALGGACYEWWFQDMRAPGPVGVMVVRAWAPGQLGAGGCAASERGRLPQGTLIRAGLEHEAGRWRVTSREVEPLSR